MIHLSGVKSYVITQKTMIAGDQNVMNAENGKSSVSKNEWIP